MRWVYLSPHLDDAILSCGGLIQKQVESQAIVEVWTIFAGDPPDKELSPFASEQHNHWNLIENFSDVRRSEDIKACQVVGARHRHLSFQDCIYRQARDGRWLYNSESAIFGEVSRSDEPLIETISIFLKTLLKPSDQVAAPMAIGNHVDHQIVRRVMEEMDRSHLLYADIPYAIRHTEELVEKTKKIKSDLIKLSQNNLIGWQEAIRAYSSQIKVLFGDDRKMCDSIINYYKLFNGFRFWYPNSIS